MKFAIITHTPHYRIDNEIFAYGPYVREMNIWTRFATATTVVTPVSSASISAIHSSYSSENINVSRIPPISFVSVPEFLLAFVRAPIIKWKVFNAMRKADHIHLRCPGTIGLIACFVQILFPGKTKTAKYAGNWDPNSRQPLSYRIQKWILSNTFLTRNMKVLVYGEWPDQTKNVKPFFTATYPYAKTAEVKTISMNAPFRFMFVGNLAPGKRPLYAVQLVEALVKRGLDCKLDIYGDGVEFDNLQTYIKVHNLNDRVLLLGNQGSREVETGYQRGQFLLLPSKSEGWPKVVAEAMFWGAIPIVTKISCVPWMLANGERGILIDADLESDVGLLTTELMNTTGLERKSQFAMEWSQQYTLDLFESEIKALIA